MIDESFPTSGLRPMELLTQIDELRVGDLEWRTGRAFGLVYHPDDPGLEQVLQSVAARFMHENALNPFRYRSLLEMEVEVVKMASALFGAQDATLTSGGSESIFLAMHAAREHGRACGIDRPRVVICETAHPAFAKAAHYLGMGIDAVPCGPDGRAVPTLYTDALDSRTVMLVASAPCFPFGVIDPVSDIAGIAQQNDLLCHVDACIGGWLLPWWAELGQPVADWDLRVAGVTSLSADLHKYGYSTKGASILATGTDERARNQLFEYDRWPGGTYVSATTNGSKPGTPIAAAWTAMRYLGSDGYLRLASRVLDAWTRMQEGVASIDGLAITGEPDLPVFELRSDGCDIDAVGQHMDARGWRLDRQAGGLHLILSPGHDQVIESLIEDLAASVAAGPAATATGPGRYGGAVGHDTATHLVT